MKHLTHERLLEALVYDPETGVFIYRERWFKAHHRVGDVAGKKTSNGYIRITIDGEPYYAHRLAWFYVHGEWPETVDHRNHDRADNRLANLRDATMSENNCHRGIHKRSKTGYKGVQERYGRFRAGFMKDGKRYDVGWYDTAEAAYAAYVKALLEVHGEYAKPK